STGRAGRCRAATRTTSGASWRTASTAGWRRGAAFPPRRRPRRRLRPVPPRAPATPPPPAPPHPPARARAGGPPPTQQRPPADRPPTLEELERATIRVQENNRDTILALAHRTFGAAYAFVPPMSVTLGMRECLSARQVRLFSDTGAWKQTALRVALFSEPVPE